MTSNAEAVRRYRERHPGLAAERARAYREANRDEINRRARARARAIPLDVKREKAARFREAHREEIRVARAAYQQDPETRPKALARQALGYAVSRGYVVRPDRCSRCSAECRPDGHHEDYARPLDVVWLCPPCHQRLHKGKEPFD